VIKLTDRREPLAIQGRRQEEISKWFKMANIFLLLVSSSFLSSDDCDQQTQLAMRHRKDGTATVIPIILSACNWQDAPFGDLNPLPDNSMPINQ
jgi:hypothetical protein